MKTTFTKKIATLALSLFAIGSFAQCPTISGIHVQHGTGTALVSAMMTPSTSVSSGNFSWSVSPSAGYYNSSASNSFQQNLSFTSTGVYTVCVNFIDSITMCTASSCTTINVTSTVSTNCNAAFSAVTSSNTCMTHFTNTSTGTNLTYQWYKSGSATMLSTQANPVLNLANGNHTIILYAFSNGHFCDSVVSVVNVNCAPTATNCNASFTYSTIPGSCVTHFYSTSTGTNLTYEWKNMSGGMGYPTLSNSSSFSASLGSGSHLIALYISSNGQFCDSVTINIPACTTSTTGCQVNSQFTVFADSLNAGNYFAYNQSTGSGTLSYLWNFGDGNTSTQQYPFHQYATPGMYVICLTTSATSGSITCSDISCDSSSVQRIASAYLMSRFEVVQQATALQEQSLLKNLSVYPNPVDNELTIEIELAREQQALNYIITDALGKVVLKNELTASKNLINTSTLDRGIYFLSVIGDNKILKTTKLVK